jgi:pilus assembly protein CpaF
VKIQLVYKNQSSELDFDGDVLIGKSTQCDLQLKGWFIAAKHALLRSTPNGVLIQDLERGTNGTYVNGKRIDYYGPIKFDDDVIEIAGYSIKILSDQQIEVPVDSIEPANTIVSIESQKSTNDLYIVWLKKIHQLLVEKMDLRRKDVSKMSDEEFRAETTEVLDKILTDQLSEFPHALQMAKLKKMVLDEAIGLGPLEDLLSDDSVSEIMVNAKDEIFIERHGLIVQSGLVFSSNRAVIDTIERIVSPIGRRIDESSPMVDARLKDGSRVNAIIPPLAIKGPSITIRKFPKKNLTIDDLVDFTSMTLEMANFLKVCVLHKKNIIVSGGTGSGKTTLLNVLANFIVQGERIITIEDAAELRLNHNHLVSLESRPSNSEGKGLVAIRDLVKNSLRMRPDRIIIGECRGAEALDMLQAMNTGHEGSLTTLHANTPRDALARMETMILMAGMDLPLAAIREQIVSAVDIIVQQTRFSCGTRKITYITEVTGIESGKIQIQDLFKFQKERLDEKSRVVGHFRHCDAIPSFYDDLVEAGVALDRTIFGG